MGTGGGVWTGHRLSIWAQQWWGGCPVKLTYNFIYPRKASWAIFQHFSGAQLHSYINRHSHQGALKVCALLKGNAAVAEGEAALLGHFPCSDFPSMPEDLILATFQPQAPVFKLYCNHIWSKYRHTVIHLQKHVLFFTKEKSINDYSVISAIGKAGQCYLVINPWLFSSCQLPMLQSGVGNLTWEHEWRPQWLKCVQHNTHAPVQALMHKHTHTHNSCTSCAHVHT